MAFVQQHAVQTLGFEAAGSLVRWLTVTLGDLGDVCSVDLHSPAGLVYLKSSDLVSEGNIICTFLKGSYDTAKTNIIFV